SDECRRAFNLERVPAIEISHRRIIRILLAIRLPDCGAEFKSDQLKILSREEFLDLRNSQAMFLDMEQQIAALAGGIEIVVPGEVLHRRMQQLLPAAADVGGGWMEAALCDEAARRDDVGAAKLAVKSNAHHAARPRQLTKQPPAVHRIGEMVQHAA